MGELLGLPIDASAQGVLVDRIILLVHCLMLLLFIGWGSYLVYVLLRFRRSRNPSADYRGTRTRASGYLEGIVALIEGILLIAFAIPLWSMRVNDLPPERDATVVRIVAEQFAWNIHYPGPDGVFGKTDIGLVSSENPLGLDRSDQAARDDIVTIDQLNVPVGKPVIIYLSSKDVIHSLSLPLFRVKQDAIPGQSVRVWFTPTMTTDSVRRAMARTFSVAAENVPAELASYVALSDYTGKGGEVVLAKGSPLTDDLLPALREAGISRVLLAPETPTEIACAQLCGLGHYRMRGFVTVQTPEEFNAWIADQEAQNAN